MLPVTIPKLEFYDSSKKEFFYTEETTLFLEHSLAAISKWEAEYKRPFLDNGKKTVRETIDYIRCMTLNPNVNPLVYTGITDETIQKVDAYIQDPMTATWFTEHENKTASRKTVTSELIYYWMTSFGIPFECENWHFNRLMTLIRICSEKNKKPRKMGKKEQARRNTDLNAARRRARNSRG